MAAAAASPSGGAASAAASPSALAGPRIESGILPYEKPFAAQHQPASSTNGLSFPESCTVWMLREEPDSQQTSNRRAPNSDPRPQLAAVTTGRMEQGVSHIFAMMGSASAHVSVVRRAFWISVLPVRAPLPTAVP